MLRRVSWSPDAGRPDDHVFHDGDVIAEADDDAEKFLEWLFGDGDDELRHYGRRVTVAYREGRRSEGGQPVNVSMYRKNDFLLQLTVRDEVGKPLDVRGASLLFVVRRGNGEPIIQKTVGDGITITDGPNGKAEVDITSKDSDVGPGDYESELLLTDALENRYTTLQGRFTVLRSLTANIGEGS